MREVFEDLKGYEDSYQISEFGRIFSKRRLVGNRIIFGREIAQEITKDGYLKVTLCKNSIQKKYYVHRLVALQFLPTEDTSLQINHKDGNKFNNNVANLEWCTKEENQNHAVEHNLMQHGEARPSAILKEYEVIEIYKSKGILSSAQLSARYGVSKNTINRILRGEKWRYLYKQYFNCETI